MRISLLFGLLSVYLLDCVHAALRNITIDNTDSSIIYSPPSQWTSQSGTTVAGLLGQTATSTTSTTANASFTFTGTAIYFISYGLLTGQYANPWIRVLLANELNLVSLVTSAAARTQYLAFYKTGLDPASPTTIVLQNSNGILLNVDAFIVTVQDDEDPSVEALTYTGSGVPPSSSSIAQSIPPFPATASTTSESSASVAGLSTTGSATQISNTTDANDGSIHSVDTDEGVNGNTNATAPDISHSSTIDGFGSNIPGSLKAGIIILVILSVLSALLAVAFLVRYLRRRRALRRAQMRKVDLLQSPKPFGNMHSVEAIHIDVHTDMYEDLSTGGSFEKPRPHDPLDRLDPFNPLDRPSSLGLYHVDSGKRAVDYPEPKNDAPFSNYNQNRYSRHTLGGWTVDAWTHDSATVMTSPISPTSSFRYSMLKKSVNYNMEPSTDVP